MTWNKSISSPTCINWEEICIVDLPLNPLHQQVNVARCRQLCRLLIPLAIRPHVFIPSQTNRMQQRKQEIQQEWEAKPVANHLGYPVKFPWNLAMAAATTERQGCTLHALQETLPSTGSRMQLADSVGSCKRQQSWDSAKTVNSVGVVGQLYHFPLEYHEPFRSHLQLLMVVSRSAIQCAPMQ